MVLTRPGVVRAAFRPHRRSPDQAALSYNGPAATSPRRCPFITAWSKSASWRSLSHTQICVGHAPERALGEGMKAPPNYVCSRRQSLDWTIDSWGGREPLIGRDQDTVESLGESHIDGVVHGHVVAEVECSPHQRQGGIPGHFEI